MSGLGHQVTVYNPHYHPIRGHWQGVSIVSRWNPEKYLGPLGNALYDLLCLCHAWRRSFDIVLCLGHAPVGLFFFLLPKGPKLLVNLDGLEWYRAKWGGCARIVLKYAEKQAIKHADAIITDNQRVEDYVKHTYKLTPWLIGYGVPHIPARGNGNSVLKQYGLRTGQYYLLISRLEPENNIAMVLDGYRSSGATRPMVVVLRVNRRERAMLNQYAGQGICFIPAVYGKPDILHELRRHCTFYFHGHAAGGTNPSLLEAMAARADIAAHENPFNRAVLGENAWFFTTARDVCRIIQEDDHSMSQRWRARNAVEIKQKYNWPLVAKQYITVCERVLAGRGGCP